MRQRLAALLALAVLPAGLILAQGAPQNRPRESRTFSEELEVREVGLIVEIPESFSVVRQLFLDPGDVLVTVDGLLQPATRMSGETPPDWSVAVYVDETLAPPDTVFHATLALAKRAEQLVRLGTVEVTVADPGPHPELAPSREALRIRQALSDLAGRAWLRPDNRVKERSAPDAEILRRQCDRLIAWASEPRPPGPRILFLVADGFAVSPEEQKALETGSVALMEPAASGRVAALQETARMLAAYGWITVPLPLRETREAEEMAPADPNPEIDEFRVEHSGANNKHSSGVPPPAVFHRPAASPFRWEAAVALQIEPDLSPLRALAAPTAGKLVGLEALLDPVLDDLAGRWQLWFQAPEPNLGRARPVEVRLRNGRRLRTRAWLRSSTPEEAAAARVRTLLLSAAGHPEGTLPLGITRSVSEGRLVLGLTVAAFEDSAPIAPGPVRTSWAFADEEEPRVHHEMVPGIAHPGQGWSHTLTLAVPPGARRLAVAVDDLARERWSGWNISLREESARIEKITESACIDSPARRRLPCP